MRTLRHKLITTLIILGAVPVFIFTLAEFLAGNTQLESRLHESLTGIAKSRQTLLDTRLRLYQKEAYFLSQAPALKAFARGINRSPGSRQSATALLKTFQKAHWGIFHHIVLADSNGNIILSPFHKNPRFHHLNQNLSKFPFWRRAKQEPGFTGFFGFTEQDHFHQLLFYPIKVNGITQSVLLFEIEINEVTRFLNQDFNLGAGGRIFLATPDGRKVIRNRKDLKANFEHTGVRAAMKRGSITGTYRDENGVAVMGTYIKEKYPWILAVELPETEFMRPLIIRRALIAVIAIVCIGAMGVLVFLAAGKLINPVITIRDNFADLAQGKGDLSARITINTKYAEIADMARSFNLFMEKIQILFMEIRGNIKETNETVHILNEQSDSFDKAATVVATSVQESSASLEELAASIDKVSERIDSQNSGMQSSDAAIETFTVALEQINLGAHEMRELTESSLQLAETGNLAVTDATQAMATIRSLGEEIGQIITIITDISDKTNLLSLNASIEAARAGEHGRGFAVVAEEISQLADTTLSSVKSIKELIAKTNLALNQGSQDVHRSSQTLEGMSRRIRELDAHSQEIAGKVKNQLEEMKVIRKTLHDLTRYSSEITRTSVEQRTASDDVSQNVQEISNRIESLNQISSRLSAMAKNLDANSDKLTLKMNELTRKTTTL